MSEQFWKMSTEELAKVCAEKDALLREAREIMNKARGVIWSQLPGAAPFVEEMDAFLAKFAEEGEC